MIYITAAFIDMYDISLYISHMGKIIQYRMIKLYSNPEVKKRSRRAPGHKITVYHVHTLSPSLIMSVEIAFNAQSLA